MRLASTRGAARRLVRVLGLATALAVLAATPAAAHNRLVAVDPADGSTVAQTPAAVVLTFAEPALALGTQVVVTGPAGPAGQGPVELVDQTVRQPLTADAPAGRYRVEWRATSADGHPITGQLSFVSETAGGGVRQEASPANPPAEAAPRPGWVWPLGALLALLAATTAVLVRRRRALDPPAG